MNLIKPSYEIIEQPSGRDGLYKHIELCGRTCYKSQDRITEDSAKKFVDGLIKSGHGSVLEHGTVYLYKFYNTKKECFDDDFFINYHYNKYSRVIRVKDNIFNPKGAQHIYITTNFRVIEENNWSDDLKYLCEPTEYHEKRVTVKFICDRGISHEFVRHRVFSFAQESTRYCNYSKDKFGNEITFIIPNWVVLNEQRVSTDSFGAAIKDFGILSDFIYGLGAAERTYFRLLNLGWKPQQARAILPNSLKTELVMTGYVSDWKHFFKLRDHSAAHPQAIELAKPLHEEFIKRNLI